MLLPTTRFWCSLTALGGAAAVGSRQHRLAQLLLSTSAVFLFLSSRLALGLRREVVLEVMHWTLARLPESREPGAVSEAGRG